MRRTMRKMSGVFIQPLGKGANGRQVVRRITLRKGLLVCEETLELSSGFEVIARVDYTARVVKPSELRRRKD